MKDIQKIKTTKNNKYIRFIVVHVLVYVSFGLTMGSLLESEIGALQVSRLCPREPHLPHLQRNFSSPCDVILICCGRPFFRFSIGGKTSLL